MKLPRRVPWASLSQLEQVYTAIYTAENYPFAIRRLSTWKFACGLPHALDAALSLLVAIDSDQKDSICKISVRQNYALAIIRFVNGFVDPLQTGAFARPIASIAAQIGIPLSLVEIRHACTHEELLSLLALRGAAKQALSWLETGYFLPMLAVNPIPNAQDAIPPVASLLKQYKNTLKPILKDTTLAKTNQKEVASVLRAFDAWIIEAMMAGWGMWDADNEAQSDWALEKLAVMLTEEGGLVPVAKKKQPTSVDAVTAELWAPLLNHLQATYPDFAPILTEAVVNAVFAEDLNEVADERSSKEEGYHMCLCGWLVWIATQWGEYEGCDSESITLLVFKALPKVGKLPAHATALLMRLSLTDPGLKDTIDSLSSVLEVAETRESLWTEDSLGLIEGRLESIRAQPVLSSFDLPPPSGLRGWRHLHAGTGWKPSPIGS